MEPNNTRKGEGRQIGKHRHLVLQKTNRTCRFCRLDNGEIKKHISNKVENNQADVYKTEPARAKLNFLYS